jgi:hypothetical protein
MPDVITRPSQIHGTGVFATRLFRVHPVFARADLESVGSRIPVHRDQAVDNTPIRCPEGA